MGKSVFLFKSAITVIYDSAILKVQIWLNAVGRTGFWIIRLPQSIWHEIFCLWILLRVFFKHQRFGSHSIIHRWDERMQDSRSVIRYVDAQENTQSNPETKNAMVFGCWLCNFECTSFNFNWKAFTVCKESNRLELKWECEQYGIPDNQSSTRKYAHNTMSIDSTWSASKAWNYGSPPWNWLDGPHKQ